MLKRIIEWSVGHRLVVFLLTTAITLAGVWALFTTPVDAIPDLSDVQVLITTEYPGKAPDSV